LNTSNEAEKVLMKKGLPKIVLIKKKKILNPGIKIDFFTSAFSSALFTGYIPWASGTFGSLFALAFVFIPGFYNPAVLFVLTAIITVLGVFSSEKMVAKYGDDPSVVVIDEVAGMWLTLAISSLFFADVSITLLAVSFFSFRFFDITKIYPASVFDKMKNGTGIMMDDIVSGVYAGVSAVVIMKLIIKINLWQI
jgi:phosphatidylglycerophosphatase A